MTDSQAKRILRNAWDERTRHWKTPDPEGWWIRARPGRRKPVMPYFLTPGAKLFRTQPDGLWLYFSSEGWVDAICIEHCSSVQNLNDKRSRYMPALNSLLVRVKRTWLRKEIGIKHGGRAERWEATKTMAEPDFKKTKFEFPVRHLRVLYAMREADYSRWIPNHVATGYEFFCTHNSLRTWNSPTTRTFLARMSSVAHHLTRP